jgi:peptidoglycan hydrolase CwlO-like protein
MSTSVTIGLESLISMGAGIVAILLFLIAMYKSAKNVGKREQKEYEMQKSIDDLANKIRSLEEDRTCNREEILKMKKDIEYIRQAVERLEAVLIERNQ